MTFCAVEHCSRTLDYPAERIAGFCVEHLDLAIVAIKAQAEIAAAGREAELARELEQYQAICSSVNEAIGKEGIHCAVTFAEAIPMISQQTAESIARWLLHCHMIDNGVARLLRAGEWRKP